MDKKQPGIFSLTVIVGYQKRSDTYTDKLGFITYRDEKSNLRFEGSWTSWRSKEIKPEEFVNEPHEGFVLNKNSGRQWGNFERAEFVRVWDTRGFEFEISTDNLMQLILHNGISKGNLIEGKCVYAWTPNGRKVTLLPETCPEYRNVQKTKESLKDAVLFEGKLSDLKVGFKYKLKNQKILTYLGKMPNWGMYVLTNEYMWGNKGNCHIFIDESVKGKYDYWNSPFSRLTSTNTIVQEIGENPLYNELLQKYMLTYHFTGIQPANYKKNEYQFKQL